MESIISTFVPSCKVNTSSALLWGLWGLELNIVDESKTFKERFDILMQMRSEIDNNSKLKIVEHYELKLE